MRNPFKPKVPKNLEESAKALKKIFEKHKLWDHLRDDENTFVAKTHNYGGRWIRNNWGLWTGDSELYKSLKEMGFTHADDMSSVILRNFYRTQKNMEPLDLDAEVKHYKDYWDKMENNQSVVLKSKSV